MRVFGVDFTCAPRRAKPIVMASGILQGSVLSLEAIERLETFAAFESMLQRPGPWIAGFDFPFGLPLELVKDLGWPRRWRALVKLCANLSRQEFRGILDGYRATRAVGNKYAHRATDHPAGSSSPMKLVNPPVALMFQEGAPRLAEAGVHIPGLCDGDRGRIALEAYPGLFARSVVGRVSYKSDTVAKWTRERKMARRRIFDALRLKTSPRNERTIIDDGSGDSLDAAICANQAAWGWRRRRANFGLRRRFAACEGWIVTAT
jgi:hypothetical protein